MIVHYKKTKFGRRSIDEESGLIVCANCGDTLNQECRAPYDDLCPCCRFDINIRKSLATLKGEKTE